MTRDDKDRLPIATDGETVCAARSPFPGFPGPVGHEGLHRFYVDGKHWQEWTTLPPLPHRRARLRLALVVLALWVTAAVLLLVVGRRP